MVFRICGNAFFLTYPKCTLSKEELQVHLMQLVPRMLYYIIARELHEDGTPHLHALITVGRRVDIKNERYFDKDGFHCNIQLARNVEASKTYCKKDGDYIETILTLTPTPNSELYAWPETLTEIEFYSKALTLKLPFQYVDHAWKMRKKPNLDILEQPVNETLMIETLRTFNWDWSTKKCLVISGRSGIGKTTWVKGHAPKPALWVTHMDSLREFREGYHKSIVFDDMGFSHLPREAQIHIVDVYDARTIHCRYATVTLPAGIPRVFTTNLRTPFSQDEAIERRIQINLF
jgi:Geminivirus Rep catalytic domain